MGFWADNIKGAEEGFAPLPVGEYIAETVTTRHKQSSNDKLMFEVAFKVLAGPHAGRQVWRNFVVSPESPGAMARFFNDMATLGAPREYFKSEPSSDAICSKILGTKVTIELNHRVWNGETRNDIGKVKPAPIGLNIPNNPSTPSTPVTPAPAAPVAPAAPQTAPKPAPAPRTPAVPPALPDPPVAAGSTAEPPF